MHPELQAALAPLLADLGVPSGISPRIDLEQWQDYPGAASCSLFSPDGFGMGVWIMAGQPVVAQVVMLADQVQEWAVRALWMAGRSASWPACPHHPDSHPLAVGERQAGAVWLCPLEGQMVASVGALAGVLAATTVARAGPAPSGPAPVGQALTAQVLTEVRRQHADIFCDASLDEHGVLTIKTTEVFQPGPELAATLTRAGDKVVLAVVQGPTDETKRAAIAAVAGVFFAQPGVHSGMATYDETTGQVVVTYTPRPRMSITPGPPQALGIPAAYQLNRAAPPTAL